MKLEIYQYFDDIKIQKVSKENDSSIIANKVKLTNKSKQIAMNKVETLHNKYNASIDKGIKKRNFFNKHKNNN